MTQNLYYSVSTPRCLALLYAQVVKQMRRRRLVTVKHRIVFGTKAAVDAVLAVCGWQINTAFVERLNLSLRQRVAAMRRRSATSCQGEDGLGQHLLLFQVYHNFVWPHVSLRQALAAPRSTHGTGSAKVWRPCTPARAAGLTDHGWSLREVWRFRVPPWPQPQTVEEPAGVEHRSVERPRCVPLQANSAGRGLENLFRVRMTG